MIIAIDAKVFADWINRLGSLKLPKVTEETARVAGEMVLEYQIQVERATDYVVEEGRIGRID